MYILFTSWIFASQILHFVRIVPDSAGSDHHSPEHEEELIALILCPCVYTKPATGTVEEGGINALSISIFATSIPPSVCLDLVYCYGLLKGNPSAHRISTPLDFPST